MLSEASARYQISNVELIGCTDDDKMAERCRSARIFIAFCLGVNVHISL
jgi:hypothetical protein